MEKSIGCVLLDFYAYMLLEGFTCRITCQFLVGKSLAESLRHTKIQPTLVANLFAIVVAEYLLSNVLVQMNRIDRDVGSSQATLQQAPEVLNTIGVYVCPYIPFNVVDNIMVVGVSSNEGIGRVLICDDVSTSRDVCKNSGLHSLLAAICNGVSPNLTTALQHP